MKRRLLAFVCVLMLVGTVLTPITANAAQASKIIKTNIPKSFSIVKQDPTATLVNFWSSMSGANGVAVDNIVNWFNASVGKQKKIYVKGIFQGGYDEIAVKVQATIQAGNTKSLPDLALLNPQGAFALKESKYIVYIGDLAAADKSVDILNRLDKNAIVACSYKGRMLGLPYANSVLVLHYNVDAFKAAGLDPANPPKTFSELAEVSKKLLIKDSKGSIKRYGFTTKLDSMWFPTFIGRQKGGKGTAFQFDFEEGRTGTPTKLVCAEDGTLKEVLTEWKKIIDTGSMDYKTSSPYLNFQIGNTAMYLNTMVNYPTIEAYFKGNPSKKFEHRMARMPSVNSDDGIATHVSGSAMYMFDRGDPVKKNATWEFVKFLTTIDASAYWAVKTGYFALNLDATNSDYLQATFKADPNTQSIYAIRSESNVNPKAQAPMIPNAAQYQIYSADQIMLMAQGKQTVDQAITNIAKKANGILKIWKDANK